MANVTQLCTQPKLVWLQYIQFFSIIRVMKIMVVSHIRLKSSSSLRVNIKLPKPHTLKLNNISLYILSINVSYTYVVRLYKENTQTQSHLLFNKPRHIKSNLRLRLTDLVFEFFKLLACLILQVTLDFVHIILHVGLKIGLISQSNFNQLA